VSFDIVVLPVRISSRGTNVYRAVRADGPPVHRLERIWAERRSGGGTSVSFTLPA